MEQGNYRDIAEMEERNWWYRARRELFAALLAASAERPAVTLDIGCGVGANYPVLRRIATTVIGVDPAPEACVRAKEKGYDEVLMAPVERLPLSDGSASFVLCADVLEHVDDAVALRELFRVLAPGGTLLLSVPAFPSLWNTNDTYSQHLRRYTRVALLDAVQSVGFTISRCTFWNMLFFLPVWCVAHIQRFRPVRTNALRNNLTLLPRWMDALLLRFLRLENRLLLRGHALPFGVTLIICARKPV